MSFHLDDFIQAARACAQRYREPVDCVQAIAPLMSRLLVQAENFLQDRHLHSDPAHYARNAILVSLERLRVFRSCPLITSKPAQSSLQMLAIAPAMSALCALIGRVLGRCSATLEKLSASDASLSLYALVWLPGQWTPVHDHGSWGVVGVHMFSPGTISSFVPNPDHIPCDRSARGRRAQRQLASVRAQHEQLLRL